MRRPQRGSGGVRERGSRGRRERAGMRMRMRLRRAPLRAARRTCAPAARSGRAPRGSTALAARNAADVSTCDPTQRAPAAAKQARANRVRFPRAGRAGNHWDASFPGTWELWRVLGKRCRTGIYTQSASWGGSLRSQVKSESEIPAWQPGLFRSQRFARGSLVPGQNGCSACSSAAMWKAQLGGEGNPRLGTRSGGAQVRSARRGPELRWGARRVVGRCAAAVRG